MKLLTTDFYLAAYLKAEGMQLINHEREDRRSIFQFSGENIEELKREYESGTAQVYVQEIKSAIRQLKQKMYSSKQPHNNNYEQNQKGRTKKKTI